MVDTRFPKERTSGQHDQGTQHGNGDKEEEWGMEMLQEALGGKEIPGKSWRSSGKKEEEMKGEKLKKEDDMPPLDVFSNDDIRQKEEQDMSDGRPYEIDAETRVLMDKREECPSCSYLMGLYPQLHSEQCEIWGKVGMGWRQEGKDREDERLHSFEHWSEEAKGDWKEWTAAFPPPPPLNQLLPGTAWGNIKEEDEEDMESEWRSERELRHASKDIVSFLRREWRGGITFPQIRDRMPWISQRDVERIAEGEGCRYRTKRIEIKWRAGEMWIILTKKRRREEVEQWEQGGRYENGREEASQEKVKEEEDGEGSSDYPKAAVVRRIQYRGA